MVNNLIEAINRAISDRKVIDDLRKIGWKEGSWEVELDDDVRVTIPEDAPIGIVTKGFFLDRFDRPWGTNFRVMVAIGGILPCDEGTLIPKYCFSTLWYNQNGEFVTIDFHKELR